MSGNCSAANKHDKLIHVPCQIDAVTRLFLFSGGFGPTPPPYTWSLKIVWSICCVKQALWSPQLAVSCLAAPRQTVSPRSAKNRLYSVCSHRAMDAQVTKSFNWAGRIFSLDIIRTCDESLLHFSKVKHFTALIKIIVQIICYTEWRRNRWKMPLFLLNVTL